MKKKYIILPENVVNFFMKLSETEKVLRLVTFITTDKKSFTITSVINTLYSRINSSKVLEGVKKERLQAIKKVLGLEFGAYELSVPRELGLTGDLSDSEAAALFESALGVNLRYEVLDYVKDCSTNLTFASVNTLAAGSKIGDAGVDTATALSTMVENASNFTQTPASSLTLAIGWKGWQKLKASLGLKLTVALNTETGVGTKDLKGEELATYLGIKEVIVLDDKIQNASGNFVEAWGNQLTFLTAFKKEDLQPGKIQEGLPSIVFAFNNNISMEQIGVDKEEPTMEVWDAAHMSTKTAYAKSIYTEAAPFATY